MVLPQGLKWPLDLLPDLGDGGERLGHLAVVPHPLVHRLHLVRHHIGSLALLKRVSAQHSLTHLRSKKTIHSMAFAQSSLVVDLPLAFGAGRWGRDRRCCTTGTPPSGPASWSCARPGSAWSLACRSQRPTWRRIPGLVVSGRWQGGCL